MTPSESELFSNLFLNIPPILKEELVETLLHQDSVRIERIVSRGQVSPPDYWYDQSEHEWVVVLKGRARIQVANQDNLKELRPGDSLFLPAHLRHRVEWTDPDEETIWLAIFWEFSEENRNFQQGLR